MVVTEAEFPLLALVPSFSHEYDEWSLAIKKVMRISKVKGLRCPKPKCGLDKYVSYVQISVGNTSFYLPNF